MVKIRQPRLKVVFGDAVTELCSRLTFQFTESYARNLPAAGCKNSRVVTGTASAVQCPPWFQIGNEVQ